MKNIFLNLIPMLGIFFGTTAFSEESAVVGRLNLHCSDSKESLKKPANNEVVASALNSGGDFNHCWVASVEKPWFSDPLRVDLRERDLSQAQFRDAVFKFVDFGKANFQAANFHIAKMSNVSGVNSDFRSANLSGAYLKDSDLSRSDFSNADLTNAVFENVILSGANFSGANLGGTIFKNCYLHGVDFSQAINLNLGLSRYSFLTGGKLPPRSPEPNVYKVSGAYNRPACSVDRNKRRMARLCKLGDDPSIVKSNMCFDQQILPRILKSNSEKDAECKNEILKIGFIAE